MAGLKYAFLINIVTQTLLGVFKINIHVHNINELFRNNSGDASFLTLAQRALKGKSTHLGKMLNQHNNFGPISFCSFMVHFLYVFNFAGKLLNLAFIYDIMHLRCLIFFLFFGMFTHIKNAL